MAGIKQITYEFFNLNFYSNQTIDYTMRFKEIIKEAESIGLSDDEIDQAFLAALKFVEYEQGV